jgi:carbamoyltransferase
MGLAPYGNAEITQTKEFIEIIKSKLVDIKDDGSIWLNMDFFDYATGLRMVPDKKWKQLFGFERRDDKDEIKQHHCNLALAIQTVTEEIVIKLAREAKRISQSDNLCMAGGVALNCVANGMLIKECLFKNIFIQPASGDAGGALGAALAAHYIYFNQEREIEKESNHGFYLGPSFSEKEIEQHNKKAKAVYHKYENSAALNSFVASKIAEGNVLGWFQGRMEFGPRALGNRSIIADARNPEMQKKLNLKIKFREGFRPFAPAVLAEDANLYFDIENDSPYMLFVAPVKTERRNQLPENYSEMPLWEKLYYQRSDIPSVTHLDFSSRIQTVHKEINPEFWELINEFKNQTGCSVLINTSFNVRGEPIVCTPTDAYRCFMNTEMDYLVINNFVYKKTEQPDWQNKEKWALSFKKD